jgi:glucose-6-phosphate 1-dehydrogenase
MNGATHGRRRRMQTGRVPPRLAMVIFGGTGDLARHMLIPALYRLWCDRLLPEHFSLIGTAVEAMDAAQYREFLRPFIIAEVDAEDHWPAFAERISFVSGGFEDPETFRRLRAELERCDREEGTGGDRLFYLAIPPRLIGTIVEQLGRAGLVHPPEGDSWSRIVVEKPVGRVLATARALNTTLHEVFDESQIYRIDHYLGKETVQNLLVFRFANVIWEPIWNRQYVDHVQVTVAEEVGVGTRAGYYDQAGAIRDMVQNHLLQVVTLLAMEPPAAYDADSIRNEKVKVLQSIRAFDTAHLAGDLVRARYTASPDGRVPGYLDEKGVAADSSTETYVALRLWIDNWRWAGVPFFLRTGKRLAARVSEVVIHFRPAPHPILDVVEGDTPAPNTLVLRIQPDEGISLRFEAKVPGLAGPLQQVAMDFRYQDTFRTRSPAAYERLLLDAMLGDPTLFARRDEVEAAWTLVTPLLDALASPAAPPVEPYPAGSWGPKGAEALLGRGHRHWHEPLVGAPSGAEP